MAVSSLPDSHVLCDLNKLSEAQIADIKRKGTVVIKDVVTMTRPGRGRLVLGIRQGQSPCRRFDHARSFYCFYLLNPQGFPEADKQFFHVYWTKAQIKARAHPNMLAASIWLNNLYHITAEQKVEGRWEDENFRACFADILSGEWSKHDPYALEPRLDAQTSLYGRPGQSTVFRAFQGWLAISKTGPGQGTLKVFPDIILSNAYIIMRPFFRPLVSLDSKNILDAKNWAFDMSTPDFPGIFTRDNGFWVCVRRLSCTRSTPGSEDSAVMYIPAVPLTPANARYVERQKDHFLKGVPPPDYAAATTGVGLVGLGSDKDIEESLGRKAMGLPISVV
ncbi:hypothetical protein B0H13DRAFT_1885471 [Mycena leptocephala]|nr:hypothetical protein B0H13DRAFT_1885471 [Mycena leptocephala]